MHFSSFLLHSLMLNRITHRTAAPPTTTMDTPDSTPATGDQPPARPSSSSNPNPLRFRSFHFQSHFIKPKSSRCSQQRHRLLFFPSKHAGRRSGKLFLRGPILPGQRLLRSRSISYLLHCGH